MPPLTGLIVLGGAGFQRFDVGCAGLDVHKSRQGRLNLCEIGQSSFQDLSYCGRWFPTCWNVWLLSHVPTGHRLGPDYRVFSGIRS